MKRYTRENFFKHTYCEFETVTQTAVVDLKLYYHSKSDSQYYYTDQGVYRYANHWGRVANCRWRLLGSEEFKNQKYHLGFAKWTDFLPMNDTDKLFFIVVDIATKKVNFQHKLSREYSNEFLFTALNAKKRVKHIRGLFKNDKWVNYFEKDADELRALIITDYITSNKNLQEIKRKYR
ncbi:MAG: hypothetical protein HRT68_13410 [Flavobacteriaceae bacterium]|nr:hypothetical protein [Flavobacteriaceae bacterium]